MVKLTPELILNSLQYTNPVKDRELDLRGYKIPIIENLGATLDQFDTIDFTDNDIRKLDGFPQLKRLKCLLLSNNRIVRIGENLEESIPTLDTLILTNNHLQELSDIDNLSTLPNLSSLSLLNNPITMKSHYREYVIFKLPHIRLLDFQKVRMKERDAANSLFKSKKGKEIQKEILKRAKTFTPGANLPETSSAPARGMPQLGGPSTDEQQAIREAIAQASSLEEIERLSQMLRSGHIPNKRGAGREEEDEPMDTLTNGN